MKLTEKDQYIIDQYEQDETMMIVIFAQWCVNNDLNAIELYKKAYPHQVENKALLAAMDETLDKKESEDISTSLVQHVLQIFGNDDLAFVIEEVMEQRNKKED